MVKLTFCLRRLPSLSREEFQSYWLETHGALVREHADALRVRRYVQLHSSNEEVNAGLRGVRGGPEGYDGVAELWWDSLEDLAAANATEAGREAGRILLEDEKRFIDLASSPLFLGEEKALVGG
ncbi:MAG: EthD domain-containing protein [Deltaproteobacteria bacterium]|nr:EthD domain-containing protein [Deltaproteobacteria bacterium]MBW2414779.1 EthD domain-containing protein [Deltaproteobacteria bacterium]